MQMRNSGECLLTSQSLSAMGTQYAEMFMQALFPNAEYLLISVVRKYGNVEFLANRIYSFWFFRVTPFIFHGVSIAIKEKPPYSVLGITMVIL